MTKINIKKSLKKYILNYIKVFCHSTDASNYKKEQETKLLELFNDPSKLTKSNIFETTKDVDLKYLIDYCNECSNYYDELLVFDDLTNQIGICQTCLNKAVKIMSTVI